MQLGTAYAAAKYDKLGTVLKKIFGQIGTIREGGLHMPTANGMTKGFAFVEFLSPQVGLPHHSRGVLDWLRGPSWL
jgi:hypothetical protein